MSNRKKRMVDSVESKDSEAVVLNTILNYKVIIPDSVDISDGVIVEKISRSMINALSLVSKEIPGVRFVYNCHMQLCADVEFFVNG